MKRKSTLVRRQESIDYTDAQCAALAARIQSQRPEYVDANHDRAHFPSVVVDILRLGAIPPIASTSARRKALLRQSRPGDYALAFECADGLRISIRCHSKQQGYLIDHAHFRALIAIYAHYVPIPYEIRNEERFGRGHEFHFTRSDLMRRLGWTGGNTAALYRAPRLTEGCDGAGLLYELTQAETTIELCNDPKRPMILGHIIESIRSDDDGHLVVRVGRAWASLFEHRLGIHFERVFDQICALGDPILERIAMVVLAEDPGVERWLDGEKGLLDQIGALQTVGELGEKGKKGKPLITKSSLSKRRAQLRDADVQAQLRAMNIIVRDEGGRLKLTHAHSDDCKVWIAKAATTRRLRSELKGKRKPDVPDVLVIDSQNTRPQDNNARARVSALREACGLR